MGHFCQGQISGKVTDSLGLAIPQAIVKLQNINDKKIIAYSFTDDNGSYKISSSAIQESSEYILKIDHLAFESYSVVVTSISPLDDIILHPKTDALTEVIINATIPIRIKKDTITFNAASFTDGTETVAEDLLTKIPGISISDDGTIKIGNQEVEKVMIEGDDFFEKGYKTLTKNLPAAPIEKVEILQRYSNNKLLKGIEESDKVALNLKLNEESKRQWFGNLDLGYGLASENRYEVRGNLLNFGKKNKYYFFTNLNNLGYDATGDISNLIRSSRAGEPGSIGDEERVYKQIGLSGSVPYFKESRFRFNNAELLSLNAIFNPSENLKIKTIGFANWDEQNYFKNSSETFTGNETNFTNTEILILNGDYVNFFGKIDIVYDISKTETLEFISKYGDSQTDINSNVEFNNNPIIQKLGTDTKRFDQKIGYSNKLTDTRAFLITGRFIDEKAPQNFTINQNNFAELFPSTSTENTIEQTSTFKYSYAGIEAHLLDRKECGDLFEIKTGHEFRQDAFQNIFSILNTDTASLEPESFQNNTLYSVNDSYLSSKYLYEFSDKWSLTGNLAAHLIHNTLENSSSIDKETIFFLNPSLSTEWKINDRNRINAFAASSKSNATISEIYGNFALSSFRSFSSGAGTFNQLDAFNSGLNYTLGNWTDSFFANISVNYSKSFDFFASDNTITQDYSTSTKTLFKDRELYSAGITLDRYLRFITSNLKLKSSLFSTDFQNIVNGSAIRQITSTNYSYGLELRSGFSGVFNYHIGTNWDTNRIESDALTKSFTNNNSFLDLIFVFSKTFNLQLQTERYLFGNINTDNTYYFADLESRYDLIPNKLSLSLSGKNLFNTEIFREFSLSDLGSSTTEYRLLPRYILFKTTYRF